MNLSRRLWWWTSPIAWWVCRHTRWTMEPGPRFRHRRFLCGLYEACWTHVCGHGYRYSFDIGCIYWFPRYAKRRLRLPDSSGAELNAPASPERSGGATS